MPFASYAFIKYFQKVMVGMIHAYTLCQLTTASKYPTTQWSLM